MSRGYYNSRTPFLYANGESVGGPAGMDCLQIRQPPAAGPFHYLINEQAKSLVALQELQHEVGALLEFRDLVIETFPNLRTKLVPSSSSSSTPATMMTTTNTSLHHNHHLITNLLGGASCTITNATTAAPTITANTVNEWTPGVRVRKKLGTTKEKKIGDNTSAIQDSGFSTETSSKETHSASSTTVTQSTTVAGIDETEDELWNLLDVIHRKGTRLKDEVEALQGVLKQQHQHSNDDDNNDFQQLLYGGGGGGPSVDDDLQQLRQERDLLLDRLAEMEAEVLASRVHTSRLQEDLENLLMAKHDLEEQLKLILQHSDQVNTRINDIHLEFITKSSPTRRRGASTTPPGGGAGRSSSRRSSSQELSSFRCNNDDDDTKLLDRVLGDQLPKIQMPDREKISAILKEHDPIILQKHLLSSTVQNQVLHQQLDTATRLEIGLADKLDKAREENDELRFQLEDKNIELEGTRARVRMLEQLQKSLTTTTTIVQDDDHQHDVSRREITTASMKAMSPLPMNLQLDHSSSTESAHDQAENNRKIEQNSATMITKRKPSKIPLKSYTAPKPPAAGGKNNTTGPSSTTTRSRSIGESPASRPHSAQSWRNRSSDGNIIIHNNNNNNNNSLSGNKSLIVTKSRNGSSITSKDSLSNKLRNSDSLSKLSNNSFGNNQRNSTLRKSTTNKWNGNNNNNNNNNNGGGGNGSSNNEKVRPKSTSSFWNFFKLHNNAQT